MKIEGMWLSSSSACNMAKSLPRPLMHCCCGKTCHNSQLYPFPAEMHGLQKSAAPIPWQGKQACTAEHTIVQHGCVDQRDVLTAEKHTIYPLCTYSVGTSDKLPFTSELGPACQIVLRFGNHGFPVTSPQPSALQVDIKNRHQRFES
jgi:hypothetical protein